MRRPRSSDPGSQMPGSASASVVHVSTPAPHPRPGPTRLDTDELRVAFDDLLAASAGAGGVGSAHTADIVRDDQVAALDAAHELLAEALTALDSQR